MAIDPNNPLLNGPKRVDSKVAINPKSEIENKALPSLYAPATVRRKNGKAERAERKLVVKKSKYCHPNCNCPEPDSPEFNSYKHGLLVPPKTRTLFNGKYID